MTVEKQGVGKMSRNIVFTFPPPPPEHKAGRLVLIGLIVFIVLENILFALFLTNYFELSSSYRKMEENYQSLYTSFSDLSSAYTSLMGNYSVLRRELGVEAVLRIGNSLQSYYDAVRLIKGLDGTRESANPAKDQVVFAARLAQHDLGNPYLPDVEAEFERIVGRRSYDIARSKINEVLLIIGVSESDPPVVKIGKILNFTRKYVHYEYEVNDVFRAPVETLGLRSGDCDDYTILVASLFEAVGIDSAVGSFKNATGARHYMVLVHLEELPGYRYWSFPDLTRFGLAKGRWVIIEPQLPLDRQGDEQIGRWTLLAAAEV
jgi:hypothetical protein